MKSAPTILPGRHLINSTLLGTNLATMGAFLNMAPGAPAVAAVCLGANTLLSFIKGYTTTAAIGGADMRMSSPRTDVGTILLTLISRCHHCPQRLLRIRSGGRRLHARQSLADNRRRINWRQRLHLVLHNGQSHWQC